MSSTHVLLTGGTGFVATHIIDQLIQKGGYKITATTRDAAKAQKLYETFPHYVGVVTFVSVPDFTDIKAFNKVFQESTSTPFDYVLHTASPLPDPRLKDIQKDIIAPGPQGVLALFQAASQYGGDQLKRIVLTSSGVTLFDPTIPADQPKTFDETNWNPITAEQAIAASHSGLAYFVSKTEAEKAAWNYISTNKPSFDLVTLLPVIVLGPNLNPVNGVDEIEQGTKKYIYSFIDGTYETVEKADFGFYTHIDVRDVGRLHVDALENKKASGQRIALVTADALTPQNVVNILNKRFPELKDRIAKGGDEKIINPKGVVPEVIRSTRTKDIFGWDYRSLEDSVVDFVNQVLEQEKAWKKV